MVCVCVWSGSCVCSVPVIFNCHACFLLCFYGFLSFVCVCVMCVYGYVSLCGDNMAVMLQSFVCEEIRAKVSVNVTDTVFVALQLV